MSISLGERMKMYEHAYSYKLPIRTPCIIRCDGKAFKTFTKGFKYPFSILLRYCMIEAAKHLCENVQNTQLAYVQSDEISLLLVERGEDTQNWFGKSINKMVSISASICTNGFNKALMNALNDKKFVNPFTNQEEILNDEYVNRLKNKIFTAEFDSRAFCLPEFEVSNAFIFRQRDAIRNSIQQVAYGYFSVKERHGIKTNMLVEKLKNEKGINYYSYPIYLQRGVCLYKENYVLPESNAIRTRWTLDQNIPLFEENRDYINRYLVYQGDLQQSNWKGAKNV